MMKRLAHSTLRRLHIPVLVLVLALLLPVLTRPAYAAQAATPDMAAIDRYVEAQLDTLGVSHHLTSSSLRSERTGAMTDPHRVTFV